ncbi:unnamed protein product [Prunus armeniaca]
MTRHPIQAAAAVQLIKKPKHPELYQTMTADIQEWNHVLGRSGSSPVLILETRLSCRSPTYIN